MATATRLRRQKPGEQAAAAAFSIVCLSPQDWTAELPTNRQQIMARAAVRGHEILFVETGHFLAKHLLRLMTGPRRRRLAERLFWFERVTDGVRVRKAVNVLPFGQRRPFCAAVNQRVTSVLLRRIVSSLPRPVVLWVYDPCALGVPGAYGEDMVVYDCVDDYAEQASPPARPFVAASDERVGKLARIVFATTSPLVERHRRNNPRTYLVRNVGDFGHFSPAADPGYAAPELIDLPRPVVGFAGNLAANKVDFDLLGRLADARPDWMILLVGPAQPAASGRVRDLASRKNVRWLGSKAYADLPRFVAAFDVGLIPYATNAYTRSCFPLKLFEYLAAAKPVVAAGLPELRGMEPDVVVVNGVGETVAAIERALQSDEGDRARRSALAAANTWETRTERLLGLITDELRAVEEAA